MSLLGAGAEEGDFSILTLPHLGSKVRNPSFPLRGSVQQIFVGEFKVFLAILGGSPDGKDRSSFSALFSLVYIRDYKLLA